MAITSESQLIDTAAISNGCSIIEAAAEDYVKCKQHVDEAAAICTAEALSVEKKTMQGSIEDISLAIDQVYSNIYSFTGQIRSAAQKVWDQQYAELQEYRNWLAQQQKQQQSNSSSSNSNSSSNGM